MADPPGAGLYRVLLALQPRGIREAVGDDWLATALARDQAIAREGPARLRRHRLREVWGALLSGIKGRMGGPVRGMGPGRRNELDGRRMRGMERLRQDLRFALRALRRAPGFTAAAVLILAGGIGTTTAMFSAVHAVLLAPLPFQDPDRLVTLYERNPDFGWDQATAAPANMLDWRERVDAFADVAAYQENVGGTTWLDEGEPRRLGVVNITGNLFGLLGVRPAMGRLPDMEDTWVGPEPWAVASHAFWISHLGASPDAVGRLLDLDGVPTRIIAVLPQGVRFPSPEADLWRSYGWDPLAREQAWFRRAHWVRPIARLRPGVEVEQARAQLDAVALQLQDEHPELNRNMFAGMTPVRGWLVGSLDGPLRALSVGVVVLLLLACVNVGNLFLVRAGTRSGELSVRRTLGAGRPRIVRQLLVEGLVLGLAGGVLGLGVAAGGIRVADALRPVSVGGGPGLSLNGAVLAFALGASLLTVVIFALWPALVVTRGDLASRLRAGGRSELGHRHRPLGERMIPVQVALAVVLVLAAGLVTRSFAHLQGVDPGIDPEGVHLFGISLPEAGYPDGEAVVTLHDALVERLESLPEVESAAVTSGVPLTFAGWTSQVMGRDWDPEQVAFEVRHRAATPGYFDVMGVPLLRGRTFEAGDGIEAPYVAVVNRAFADTYYPDGDALGQEITFDRSPDENSIWRTIVGVVGDERQRSLVAPADPEVWEPMAQDWGRARLVVLRTNGAPPDLGAAIRAVLSELDPTLPMIRLRPMQEVVDDASADARFLLFLFNVFGVLAFLLAMAGIYGVTAQSVRRRVPEFGVRLALGAGSGAVSRLVLVRVLGLALAGTLGGVALGAAGGRLLEALLFGVGARDPVTFLLVPAALLAATLLSAWLPARRAARVDPVESLRAG